MKKFFLTLAFSMSLAGLLLLNPSTVFSGSPQKSGKKATFPENVGKVAEKSCMPCHSAPGNRMAMAHVNLDKWGEYSAEKQAKKAAAMCKMVSKGAMPPKSFRNNNPDKVPTQKDVEVICEWSKTLQTK